jgi:peptide/nickel transport system substrate-binding protein
MPTGRPREYQRLLDDVQLRERTRHYEYMSPTAGYVYIGWNQERDGKPPCSRTAGCARP